MKMVQLSPELIENVRKLPKNYSSWVVFVVTGAAFWWLDLDAAEQARYLAEFPWLKYFAPAAAIIAFASARVAPQTPKSSATEAVDVDAEPAKAEDAPLTPQEVRDFIAAAEQLRRRV